jgi:uncharacterized OsmC-like protein
MSVTSKQWVVKVVSAVSGPLVVSRDGAPLPAEIGPGLTTPVDLLLVSVGTCFALSCHAAFTMRKLPRIGLEVVVTGSKAPDPPSRLAHVELDVAFDRGLSNEDARAVAALAKQLCTVTNTLSADPRCALSVSVTNGSVL